MPFAPRHLSSIQLAICKTVLDSLDIASDTFYFNLEFIKRTRCFSNVVCSDSPRNQLCWEWVFAQKLWIVNDPADSVYRSLKNTRRLKQMRSNAHKMIDDLSEQISWNSYDVVAFTCTFSQLIPSLCLAKHIKQKYPGITIMFGGMEIFEDLALEYMKHLNWVDYMFVGEADRSLHKVMTLLKNNETDFSGVKGIFYRFDGEIRFHGVDKVPADAMIYPDYSGFFEQINKYKANDGVVVEEKNIILTYEMSRGCSYAAKQVCKFCSIESYQIGGRPKDVNIIVNDIYSLYNKWKGQFRIFGFTDLLSDTKELRYIFPKFKKLQDVGIRFRTELKSILKPEDLRILREGGINWLFAGVESLSPEAIKSMKKGISVIQSISFLKWCKYYSIKVKWNMLTHVPFEKEEWYDDIDETMKKIQHFQGPFCIQPIVLPRFGAYLNEVPNVKPCVAYKNIYPKYFNIQNVAYHFEYDSNGVVAGQDRINKTRELSAQLFQKGHLRFVDKFTIRDARDKRNPTVIEITESQHNILKQCLVPLPSRHVNGDGLEELVEKSLIIQMEGKSLSLVEIEDEDADRAEELSRSKSHKVSLKVI